MSLSWYIYFTFQVSLRHFSGTFCHFPRMLMSLSRYADANVQVHYVTFEVFLRDFPGLLTSLQVCLCYYFSHLPTSRLSVCGGNIKKIYKWKEA
jgi:hypothetical protein